MDDRSQTTERGLSLNGLGLKPAMEQIEQLLQNQDLLLAVAKLGGAKGQEDPVQLYAYASTVVSKVLAEELEIQRNGPASRYSAVMLEALEAQGLNTAHGRLLVRMEALVSERTPEQIAVDRARDPNQVALERKVEQYQALAMAGRFDVIDPQFKDYPSFAPYAGLWQQISPLTQEQILNMQQQWNQVARYWGAGLLGEPVQGPAPEDRWGIKEIALIRVEVKALTDLKAMKAELLSGTATPEGMQEYLQRLDQYKELLGADLVKALVSQVFGKDAEAIQGWLDFRDQFVGGKKEYWHKVITEGKEAADLWDKTHYQPLREQRDAGLQHEVFGALVQAVQHEAVAVHNAYAQLYQAKQGWWQAYINGGSSDQWQQQGLEARKILAEVDPKAVGLWDSGSTWALDREMAKHVVRFEEAYRQYWNALLHGDAAALTVARTQLEQLPFHVVPVAKEMDERYQQELKKAFQETKKVAATSADPQEREQAAALLDFWRKHLPHNLIEQWEKEYGQKQPLHLDWQARSADELREKFQKLGWTGMIPHAELIWKVSQELGLPAEIMAAKIYQESKGDVRASAGDWAGKGLMQVEFGAHYDNIPGSDRASKERWILDPENNLRFGGQILKNTLDTWIAKYGPDEGLKRGLQYYNYGSGAAEWVERHSKSPEDWQYWVLEYHKTHKYDRSTDSWHEVKSGGDYGNPYHWQQVHGYFVDLRAVKLDRHATQEQGRGFDGRLSPPIENYVVTSHFDAHEDFRGPHHKHTGIDLDARGSNYATVKAVAPGTVIHAGFSKPEKYGPNAGYGNCVIIDHGNGVHTYYAHLQEGSLKVKVGDRVSVGHDLGQMGHTGNTVYHDGKGLVRPDSGDAKHDEANHLHFEVRIHGNPVDPHGYLSGEKTFPVGRGN